LIQHQKIHPKLFVTVISLVLLVMVTYAAPFLQKTLAESATHIIAAGDWGCSSNTEKTVQTVSTMKPQLLLALGDYSYEKTSTCWLNLIKPVDSITKINFGNHEDSQNLINSYLTHFGLSQQYYSFDVHNVHVLTMATEEKFGTNSDQYNFVVNDLRKAANNPDIKWIIVSMHYPFYSSPNTCKESDCAGNAESRDIFHPVFDKYGVDLVLQGHVHNYQRSYPLNYNQESSENPLVTSTNKADYNNPNGVIFAIVGSGGVNLHGLSGSSAFMANQEDSKFGILDMHFSDTKLDAKFVTNDGSTMDHFTVSKTVKKKIIEQISDNANNTVTIDKLKSLLHKEDAKSIPLSDKADIVTQDKSKPLSDTAVTIDKLKSLLHKGDAKSIPLSDKADTKVTQDKSKPISDIKDTKVIQDKSKPLLDKADAVTQDKSKPISDIEDTKGTDANAKPLADKADTKITEYKAKPLANEKDKPAVSNNPPTDDKPAVSNNPPTDDKPAVSHEDKSTSHQNSDIQDKSTDGGLLGPVDNSNQAESNNEINHDTEKTIDTNEQDPFGALTH